MLYSSSISRCCHDATKLTRNMQCLSRQLVQHMVTMPQCLHVPSIYRIAAVARRGTVSIIPSTNYLWTLLSIPCTLYHLPATDQTSPSARCRLLVTYPGGVSGQSLIFHPVCKTRSKKRAHLNFEKNVDNDQKLHYIKASLYTIQPTS